MVIAGLDTPEMAKKWHKELQEINPNFFLQIDGKDAVVQEKKEVEEKKKLKSLYRK